MRSNRFQVLVVDDEPDLCILTKQFLERSKELDVTTACSVQGSREAMAAVHFDAIVSDYQMPGEDGIQFLKSLRSSGDSTPFILFTGRGREEVVIEALNSGADFYLQKGGNPLAQFTELEYKIRQAVRRKKAEESLRQREERLRSVLNTAPDIIITVDQELTITEINHIDPVIDSIGKSMLYFIDSRYHQVVREELGKVFRLGVVGHYELVGQGVGGEPCWYETNVGPIFENGSVVSAVLVIRVVTERKLAEIELRESEERFRSLAENTSDGMAISIDENLIDVNRTMSALLNYRPDELVGKHLSSLFSPESKNLLAEQLRLTDPGPYEARLMEKNGNVRTVLIQSRNIRWSERTARLSTIRDITEHRLAEEALRKSEDRYKSLFESAPLAIIITRRMVIEYANPSYLKMFGFSSIDDLKECKPLEVFVPECRPQILENIMNRVKGLPVPDCYEAECVRRDGKRFPVLMYLTNTMFVDGQATVGFIQDITDRKRAEDDLKGSEERYSKLIATIPDSVVMTDLTGKITLVNQQLLTETGYSLDELIGESMFRLINREESSKARNNAKKMILGRLGSVEYNLVVKGGRQVLFEVNGDVLRDSEGRPIGFVFVCRDLTERKGMELKLMETNSKLKVMTSITRHDIKNQIMALEGYLGPDGCERGRRDPRPVSRQGGGGGGTDLGHDRVHPGVREHWCEGTGLARCQLPGGKVS